MSLLDDILRVLEPAALNFTGGMEQAGKRVFGQQTPFLEKLKAADIRMKGQNPLALDPITAQMFQELATSFNPVLGVFRQLGMQRVGNLINPTEMIERAMEQPGFRRYLELARQQVARALGEKFQVFRGLPEEQFLRLLGKGAKERAIGVTTDPQIAKGFAAGFQPSGHIMGATATPESIMGLIPRRMGREGITFPAEMELLVDPRLLTNVEALSKFVPIRPGSLIGETALPSGLLRQLLAETGGRFGVR